MATTASNWRDMDVVGFAELLNSNPPTLPPEIDFTGWHAECEPFNPPTHRAQSVLVFGRVSMGEASVIRQFQGENRVAPVRDCEILFELFITGPVNRAAYEPIFDNLVSVLRSECGIDPDTFNGPSRDDVAKSEFNGFSAVGGTIDGVFF